MSFNSHSMVIQLLRNELYEYLSWISCNSMFIQLLLDEGFEALTVSWYLGLGILILDFSLRPSPFRRSPFLLSLYLLNQ